MSLTSLCASLCKEKLMALWNGVSIGLVRSPTRFVSLDGKQEWPGLY